MKAFFSKLIYVKKVPKVLNFRNFITCILTMLASLSFAQTLTIDGASLTLTENSIVAVNGSATNNGEIYNSSATFAVSENWTNQNSYESFSGRFLLNGTNTQFINPNNQQFNILEINGIGDKLFESNATIYNKLILNTGVLKTNSEHIFLIDSLAIIENASENSYIEGMFYRSGKGDKFFPTGKNGMYRPITLLDLENDSLIIGCELHTPNIYTNFDKSLLSISTEKYWEQKVLQGNYTGTKLKLAYNFEDNIQDTSQLVVAVIKPNEVFRNIGRTKIEGDAVSGFVTSDWKSSEQFTTVGTADVSILEEVFVPSAFSPRATDENDRGIRVYGQNLIDEDFTFTVFNKWGNAVFTSNSLEYMQQTGWQGEINDNKKAENLNNYEYILRAKLKNGKAVTKKGSITIIN